MLVVHLLAYNVEDKITNCAVFRLIRLDVHKSPSRVNQITSTVWPKTQERRWLKSDM